MIGFMLTSLNVVNIAVEFFASSKRVAIVLRKRVIGTRFCVRSPNAAEASAAGAGAAAFAGAAVGLFNAASTSSLEIRPPLPVPTTSLKLLSLSQSIKRRTDGASTVHLN